jgi:deoxyinosine 3'endonuclease (endonuclease V)
VVHDVAAAGVAKTILTGAMKGDSLILDGEEAGRLIQSSEGRTYFVSVGHKANLDSVCRAVASLSVDPMMSSHHLATRFRRSVS